MGKPKPNDKHKTLEKQIPNDKHRVLEKHKYFKQGADRTSQHGFSRSQEKLFGKSGKRELGSRDAVKGEPHAIDVIEKRKKKGIRIDPHDFSNKRIDDDGVSKSEYTSWAVLIFFKIIYWFCLIASSTVFYS